MQKCNLMYHKCWLMCRPRRDARCHCQTCVIAVLTLLLLLCLSVSTGLTVAYLQLRRELDVIRNRLVTSKCRFVSCNFWCDQYCIVHTLHTALLFLQYIDNCLFLLSTVKLHLLNLSIQWMGSKADCYVAGICRVYCICCWSCTLLLFHAYVTTATTISQPLYKLSRVGQQPQLRTGGFHWSSFMALHAHADGN